MSDWGWRQIAFLAELEGPLTEARLDGARLVLVRGAGGDVRAFAGDCPHRGASLALGSLDGDHAIVCAFHGYRIALGHRRSAFCVEEYTVLQCGGLVFARRPDDPDLGFAERLRALERDCWIVPGFVLPVRAPAALVVENAFDGDHFQAVHQVRNQPMVEVSTAPGGALVASTELHLPPSPWQRTGEVIAAPLTAHVFSPGLVVSDVGGPYPYHVITSASAGPDGTTIRLSFAMPRNGASEPDRSAWSYMIDQARLGLEADRRVWESLPAEPREQLTERDTPILAFRAFCDRGGGPE